MTSAQEERVGQVLLDKFLVLRRLGGGGMGEVFEVQHLLTRHVRALKVIPADLAKEPRFAERFRREAGIAGRLKTPFVAETFDAGWLEDGSAYVLMELVAGRSLHLLLADEGMLPAKRTASILAQIAEGIQVAHDASIVHRDLKPENVFVETTADGRDRVKILDFGVSKHLSLADEAATRLTREGSAVGTPYYMSPEQAAGKDVDGRADVWSIGVMAYECLTGRLPFDGSTVGEVMLKIGAGTYVPLEHRRPDVEIELVEIVTRALEPDREKRFPTAEALRRALLPLAGGEPAARAKTISDGAPVDRAPVSLPRPAPVPAVLDAPKTARSDPPREAPRVDVRAPAQPSRDRSALWVVGAGVASVALGVLVVRELGDAPSAGSALPDAGVVAAPATPVGPEPDTTPPSVETAEVEATDGETTDGETAETEPTEAETRRVGEPPRETGRPHTPTAAELAGLEESPYGP